MLRVRRRSPKVQTWENYKDNGSGSSRINAALDNISLFVGARRNSAGYFYSAKNGKKVAGF